MNMPPRTSRADGRQRRASSAVSRATGMATGDAADRETWLCRSTLGAGSDDEDNLWSDEEDAIDGDDGGGVGIVESNGSHTTDSAYTEVMKQPSSSGGGGPDVALVAKGTGQSTCRLPAKVRRKLTLDDQFSSTSALKTQLQVGARKHMPPSSTTLDGVEHKKKRGFIVAAATPIGSGKRNQKDSSDENLTIYMDVAPDEAAAPARIAVANQFHLRRVSAVYVTAFVSTASIHCTAFNASPGLRRVFGIEATPVGLALLLAWIFLGLAGGVGGGIGDLVRDRVVLLRRACVLWAVSIVALQTARLPLPLSVANALVAIGFIGAVIAHGVIVPNAIVVGAKALSAQSQGPQADATDMQYVDQRTNHTDTAATSRCAISHYMTMCFASTVSASSLVQGFYFSVVNLDGQPGHPAAAPGSALLRSRRAFFVTLLCNLLLLALVIGFLFHSRQHRSAQSSLSSSQPVTPHLSAPEVFKSNPNELERKLVNELQTEASAISVHDIMRLGHRVLTLYALFVLVVFMLLGVGSSLISHIVLSSRSIRHQSIASLAAFSLIFLGWLFTLITSVGQLSPTKKLFVEVRAMELPSVHMYAAMALLSVASASVFGAFVRAQLYTTMYVQTCQLRLSVVHDALNVNPNVLGAGVGLSSVLLLPLANRAITCMTSQSRGTRSVASRSVSPARRASFGVLLYLVAVFLSGVVELYRRDKPQLALALGADRPTPTPRNCDKSPSDFSVLWTMPHLCLLAVADVLFRLGAAEQVHALTVELGWLGVAQGALALADGVGYAAALALSTTLSRWLYQSKTSDLVLILLLTTSFAALWYALTKRIAERIGFRNRHPRRFEDDEVDASERESLGGNSDDDSQQHARRHRPSVLQTR